MFQKANDLLQLTASISEVSILVYKILICGQDLWLSRARYRDPCDFDRLAQKVEEFQATLPTNSHMRNLDDATYSGWNHLHVWCYQMIILIYYPLAEDRSSALIKAAGEIHSRVVEMTARPSLVGLDFQTSVGFDSHVHNMFSPLVARSTRYIRHINKLSAWLNEKRKENVTELDENDFWVRPNL